MKVKSNVWFAVALALSVIVSGSTAYAEALPGGTLDPASIPKYALPLIIPPEMPPSGVIKQRGGKNITYYEIAVRQFDQQILPAGFPMTTVWSYGSVNHPGTFNYPAFTIEARVNKPIRVKWINGLVDGEGNFLPHLLPVDQTLHWANPPGPTDTRTTNPDPYTGPVPMVVHVHGAHVPDISDGFPEAWYLPDAGNISSYVARGSFYNSVIPTVPGAAVFEYPNDQRATTLWYHDHSLGITRLNVYAGPAGFWLLRGDGAEDGLNLPGRAPKLGDKPNTKYYEIPIVVQDRSFNADGSLYYPSSREFFDGFTGPYIPDSDVPPTWNPEFFGNTMVVNGRTWPYLEVEPRKYRFRLLNGCNSRFLILKLDRPGLNFHQIGSDGGLLPGAPVVLNQLLMAPAERADVIVDFSGLNPGDEVVMLNLGPDEPFGGLPVDPEVVADPETTGQVMRFKVVGLTAPDDSETPSSLIAIDRLTTDLPPRDITLNEEVSELGDFPIAALLGTGADGPLTWGDDITETPTEGDTEMWRILNLTVDSHPVHLHLVMFQVIDRIPLDADGYHAAQEAYIDGGKIGAPPDPMAFADGPSLPPNPWEMGWKDTVIANPGEITRIIAKFDLAGLYVWHCHILEHEDNEMMRPYSVMPK